MKVSVEKQKNVPKDLYKEVSFVQKFISKHGRLKFKKMTKKEKRAAIASCPHHMLTKDGKLKNRVRDNMDGTVSCPICGARFSTSLMPVDKFKKLVNTLVGQINLLQWCMGAIFSMYKDQKTYSFLTETKRDLMILPKVGKRITKVFQKSKSAKRKKNKNRYNISNKSGTNYGGWANR